MTSRTSIDTTLQRTLQRTLQQIMQKQPIVNVGMIGHVANGKSTIVKCLSSKATQQYSKEKERNITIRLGYANTKIWKCSCCRAPASYSASNSSVMDKNCDHCGARLALVNHVSIVDCPGHSELTSTMLNGSSVMDYSILVEACNNPDIPALQTAEHLMVTRAANIPTRMIIMNKIDLVNRSFADDQIDKITRYVKHSLDETVDVPPIVPVSGTFNVNIDVVCQYMSMIQIPKNRTRDALFKMIVIRSFDINKPGSGLSNLHGGVIGGTIVRGTLNRGDRINIYPGIYKKIPDDEKKKEGADFRYAPISGEVLSIKSDMNELDFAIPGGLLGIQLTIDPAFTRNDLLSGSMVLKKSELFFSDKKKECSVKIYDKIIIRMDKFIMEEEQVTALFKNTTELMLNVNSNNIDCVVLKYSKKSKELFVFLGKPIAIDNTDNSVTIMSKSIGKEIMGRGIIMDGIECEPLE
jgi:translation initiation factor 2 subunit 3